MDPTLRPVVQRLAAERTVEGRGFVVRRPFPARAPGEFAPFLVRDERRPVDYEAQVRQAIDDYRNGRFGDIAR
jgi:hypothetical protein